MWEMTPVSTYQDVLDSGFGCAKSFPQPPCPHTSFVKSADFVDLLLREFCVPPALSPSATSLFGHISRIGSRIAKEQVAWPITKSVGGEVPHNGIWLVNVTPVADEVVAAQNNAAGDGVGNPRSPFIRPVYSERTVPVHGASWPNKATVVAPRARGIVMNLGQLRLKIFEVCHIVWDIQVAWAETGAYLTIMADLAAIGDRTLESLIGYAAHDQRPSRLHYAVSGGSNNAIPDQARVFVPRAAEVIVDDRQQKSFEILRTGRIVSRHRCAPPVWRTMLGAALLSQGRSFIHYSSGVAA